MSCQCKTQIEAALTERFAAEKSKWSDHKVELQGYGFGVRNNTLFMQPFMAYRGVATDERGQTKSNKGSMVFKFCPFCGDQFDKPENGATP